MPEFIPQHTPRRVDEFTAGYLDASEWLLDEDINRAKLRGWSRAAIRAAKRDCREFQKYNKADLELYCEVTGRDMETKESKQ